MTFDEFIASLRDETDASAFIEGDKEKEIQYLLEHRWGFRSTLMKLPDSRDALRILDIGPTPFTLYMKKRWPHYDVYALDRTDMLQSRFASHGVELRSCNLDDDSIPYDDALFDVVIFTEVMEHIFRAPSEVLGEIRRILKPGGQLIISVPHIAVLHRRIRLLMGISPLASAESKFKKDWVHGHGHLHEYTLSELAGVVAHSGFKIEKRGYLRPSVTDALAATHRSTTSRLGRAAYCAVQNIWPSWGSVVWVQARK